MVKYWLKLPNDTSQTWWYCNWAQLQPEDALLTYLDATCFSYYCIFGGVGGPPLQFGSGSPGAQETSLDLL